jgi:hypothetical protein
MPPKDNKVTEEKKTLAKKILEINQESLDRRKAFREAQKEKALKDLIASQKSSRGPSRAGRLSGAASFGGGNWSKASNLGK